MNRVIKNGDSEGITRINTKRRKIVEEYCEQYKNEKIYTLSKRIEKEYPNLYKSFESIRQAVNIVKGHAGPQKRHKAKVPTPLNYDTTPTKKIEVLPAKILILDIETAPLKAYIWDIWNQNININQIINDWFILTWSAKWLCEKKIYNGKLTKEEALRQDDKRIMQGLWALLNEADMTVTHNGDKFDLPRINTRFLINKIPPPQPYQSIDTLKTVRRQFGFVSNKQEFLNIKLETPRKLETGGMGLWIKCLEGCEKSLKKMSKYNDGDILSLEENYLKLRPFIKPHPNVSLFIIDEHERCPSCGSNDLTECGKPYATSANLYESLVCKNCKSYSRRRKPHPRKNKVLSSLPK